MQPVKVVTKIKNRHSQEESVACFSKKYKLVALKVKQVFRILSSRFIIIRNSQRDSLEEMPKLSKQLSKFMLKKTVLIQKKKEIRNKNHRSGFLWLKERRLMHWLIEQQNKAFI